MRWCWLMRSHSLVTVLEMWREVAQAMLCPSSCIGQALGVMAL
jgi:hypothetical protein